MIKRTVILFGASGFVGQHLCLKLIQQGFEIRGLVRDFAKASALLPPEVKLFYANLPDQIDPKAFEGANNIVIHCAYGMELMTRNALIAVNVTGSKKIVEMSRTFGVKKIIFLSSMSAHEGALSVYGKTKLLVEQLLDKDADLIVKPGFVIGDGSHYRNLVKLIRRIPIVPLFYMGVQPIQTIAIEDLCEGICRAIDADLTGTIHLAEPHSVSIKSFYQTIAQSLGLFRIYAPCPGTPALLLMRLLEFFGVKLPFSSENLLGLKRLIDYNIDADLEKINFVPRSMHESVLQLKSD